MLRIVRWASWELSGRLARQQEAIGPQSKFRMAEDLPRVVNSPLVLQSAP